jgi:hypothetical protein
VCLVFCVGDDNKWNQGRLVTSAVCWCWCSLVQCHGPVLCCAVVEAALSVLRRAAVARMTRRWSVTPPEIRESENKKKG